MLLKNRADKHYFVYIMASNTRVLYVGVTNDLRRRVLEHMKGEIDGFTVRYRVKHLVHFEAGDSPQGAIMREKQIKGWRREKKVALIEAGNPDWRDLAEGWFPDSPLCHSEDSSQ
jgi:putative endonuclease